MFKKVYLKLQVEQKTTLIILSVLMLCGVIKAGYYTIHYGGVDLRQRVVGARLINKDNSAYFYKWSPGGPEKFIDPNVRKGSDINGVTVAPGALYFQSLFSFLKYPVLRIVWTIVQYLLIVSIFYFFLFQKDVAAINKFAIVVIGGIFFLCSPVWFINIERGQIYILYAFLFTSIFFSYTCKNEYSKYISGILISIAIYCRPTFIVLIIPILFNLEKPWLRLLGKYSYGIYIFHPGIAQLVLMWFKKTFSDNFFNYDISYLLIVLTLTIIVAAIPYELFEIRFLKIKRRFSLLITQPI